MRLALILLLACCAPTRYIAAAPPSDTPSEYTLEVIEPTRAQTDACEPHLKMLSTVDSDMAESLVAGLKACEDRAVVLEIDSLGGNVGAAREIQKAIEERSAPVACVVDGYAMSAAFDILQSCTSRHMTPRSILMNHSAAVRGASGHSDDMENQASMLRAIDEARAIKNSRRMGMKLEDYKAKVQEGREWYLALTDALTFHAVDSESTVAGQLAVCR